MIRLFLIAFLAAFTTSLVTITADAAQPVKGVLDLRNVEIDSKYTVRLNGEWEFYWKKFYRPNQFRMGVKPLPDGYIKVPSYWTDFEEGTFKTDNQGYATYRLTILLPDDTNIPLGIDVKVFDSSYDLYVNGTFMGNNGISGTTAETSVPEYGPRIYRFNSKNDTVEIIFNVSNFHHRRGGFWLPAEFGAFDEIQNDAARRFGRAWSSVSVLAAFTLFFFFFFILYRNDKTSLYFAIALLGLALRPLFTNQFLVYMFIQPSWQWIVRWEYLSMFIAVGGAHLFMYSIYRNGYLRLFALLSSSLLSLMAVATMFLPVTGFSWFSLPVYLLVAFFAVNSIAASIIKLLRDRLAVDVVYVAGFSVIIYAAIHDIILAMSNLSGHGEYIISEAIMIFIFIQSGLLIYRWVDSFREKERLRNNLEQLNRNLESMVAERTRELVEAKTTAEEYSRQIEVQNKNLTETINLKNKVFSVIAHDLRSPVVNIQYILNLLKEEEYKEKYETLAGSCIHYSQMVINLLENMLVWGRGQEDRIRYAPERHDISGIILTNMSIYKDSADRKNITVNFTQIGGTMAWVDRELVDIIVRNLLSNAIKFTNKGGRISILLKEKVKPVKELTVKICDNGVGIPPERQKAIFSSETLESTPGTENEKGTGFGLKLSNELVKVNRGTLSIESKPGDGSCFTVSFPVEPL